MYEYQYLVGGALSLLVSFYILLRRPNTLALKSLSIFGLTTMVWEFSVFLSKTAPDSGTAANFYFLVILTSHVGLSFYLLTILNTQDKKSQRINILALIPAAIQVAILPFGYFGSYKFSYSEYGWYYRIVSYQLPLVVVSVIFIGYLAGIIMLLFGLSRKTRFPLLKKKYKILVISFTSFQAVGTILINALISFNLLSPAFRVGGILQFLTFLSIWYVLSLQEKKTVVSYVGGEEFSEVFSSFLTVYYNLMTGSQLGEDFFRFTNFLKMSRIYRHVSIDERDITFKTPDNFDMVELIKRNLMLFSKGDIEDQVVDHFLRVLNVAYQKLGTKFEEVVSANLDFLLRSDLIYGISNGKLLDNVVEDKSLSDLNDTEACLKIYKRILLPIIRRIQKNSDFESRFSKHNITEVMRITKYGEISIKTSKERKLGSTKKKEIPVLVEMFNSFLSWIYEKLLMDPTSDVERVLDNLKIVLKLNKVKADDLGVYPTLLGMLATKIPRTQISRLYSDYLEELVEEKTRELKVAQENLLKSQRLATIGEAAAMVGHDLRNPLQSMVYSLYIAKKELQSSPNTKIEEILENINEQIYYMNKIVSDLQDYAKPIKPKNVKTNLRKLLDDTISTIRVSDEIQILIEIEKNFPELQVDHLMMKRVLTNLITNALQAMENKVSGQLTINAYSNNDKVLIKIQDTGIGIPEENMNRIFQPLFTTKAKGQGLGLAVCKRLVEALGGSIYATSQVDKNTIFTIEIPSKNLKIQHSTH